jgi:hypothetical protein
MKFYTFYLVIFSIVLNSCVPSLERTGPSSYRVEFESVAEQRAERQRQQQLARQREAERQRQQQLARQREAEQQRQQQLARQREAERQRQQEAERRRQRREQFQQLYGTQGAAVVIGGDTYENQLFANICQPVHEASGRNTDFTGQIHLIVECNIPSQSSMLTHIGFSNQIGEVGIVHAYYGGGILLSGRNFTAMTFTTEENSNVEKFFALGQHNTNYFRSAHSRTSDTSVMSLWGISLPKDYTLLFINPSTTTETIYLNYFLLTTGEKLAFGALNFLSQGGLQQLDTLMSGTGIALDLFSGNPTDATFNTALMVASDEIANTCSEEGIPEDLCNYFVWLFGKLEYYNQTHLFVD